MSASNTETTKEQEIIDLSYALEACRMQFQFYADEHTKAGKTEKAKTNQEYADND